MRECRLRQSGHVLHRLSDALVLKCENIVNKGVKRERGRPKVTLKQAISKDIEHLAKYRKKMEFES